MRPDLEFILTSSLERTAEAAAELCEEQAGSQGRYHPQKLVEEIRRLRCGKRENVAYRFRVLAKTMNLSTADRLGAVAKGIAHRGICLGIGHERTCQRDDLLETNHDRILPDRIVNEMMSLEMARL